MATVTSYTATKIDSLIADAKTLLRGEIGDAVVAGRPRKTVEVVTPVVAGLGEWVNTIELGRSYRLLSIVTTHPCRVRLYGTAIFQSNDALRPIGSDPMGNHGLMFEFISTADNLISALTPTVDGANLETSPSKSIPVSIQNLTEDESAAITVTFLFLETE